MYITDVSLHNFRNYEELDLKFHRNVNLILGKNAQGKTNLIESIYICSMGKSFRTNKDAEMILFGKDYGRIKVHAEKSYLPTTVDMMISKESKKSVKIDGVKIKKASELLKNLYIVIFSPEDLKIVKDEPEKRRRFIDRELSQLRPKYYENFYNFKKALIQRNAYLKEMDINRSILDVWDMQLAKYGASIMMMRRDFIDKISQISHDIHYSITNEKEHLSIQYEPNIKMMENLSSQEDYYYHLIGESYGNDMRQRTTTRGPHKDDMSFLIGDIDARSYGSQGQQRTAALSLKLAELNLIREETDEDGILILDDVMSELDLERQEFLVKSLSDRQMFITTTEIPDALRRTLPAGKVFFVEGGKVREESYEPSI
ncbi:MAG: DNA replication/repair protein RecF [Firmicutes bacterium]|jgi:DNA replication and repair protein RecF|nr:DNA replication/repair protein RecF [Bacillota bacterium]